MAVSNVVIYLSCDIAEHTPPRSPKPERDWSADASVVSNESTPSPYHSNTSGDASATRQSYSARSHPKTLHPDSIITENFLLAISLKCSRKFLELGISLGINNWEIENLVCPENRKAFGVLLAWKRRGKAECGALAEALEGIGRRDIALKYCYAGATDTSD